MKKSVLSYTLKAVGALLLLYMVCDRMAQVQPLTFGGVVQSCRKDIEGLFARAPYSDPQEYLHPGSQAASMERSTERTPEASSRGLFRVKVYTPDQKTSAFVKEHYPAQ